MVLADAVILKHLLQTLVEALRTQPLTPLVLQLLLSLQASKSLIEIFVESSYSK